MRIIIYFLVGIILSSCTKSNFTNKINLDYIDEVCIDYDSISKDSYRFSSSLFENGKSYFYGLQKGNFLIDIYNLSDNQESHIRLPKEGPNKLNDIVSITAISTDSILVYDFGRVLIFNQQSDIIFEHKFDIPNSIPNGRIISTNEAPIIFHENKMYFLYSPDELNFRSEKWFKHPIAMEYDINEKLYTVIPIHYSKFMTKNKGNFGFYLWSNLNLENNKLIYNFPFQPEVFTYDLTTGQKGIFNDKNSMFAKDYSESISYKAEFYLQEAVFLENTFFHKVIYDDVNDVYYRFNNGKTTYKVDDLNFNSYEDKPLALTVFDNQFKVLGEFEFEKKIFDPIQVFSNNGFLYISKSHFGNENNIEGIHCFQKLRIKKV